jgi:spatacsin
VLLHGLVVSKEKTATEILLLLEAALLRNHCPDNSIVKQLLHWGLAVKFAKYHQMKLPEQFLKHCARADLWLPFVLFIQLHQYPVDQVS